jgi:hypothetical protein
VRPTGKGATKLLAPIQAKRIERAITDHIAEHPDEQSTELQSLVHGYCQYGPIGLLEAIPSALPPLVDPDLQACVDFHRLAKHRRADAGGYIREILSDYASDLKIPPLQRFVARYAFAQDRRFTGWFIGEGRDTMLVPKADRRLNQDIAYVHQQWRWCARPLSSPYILSERHPKLVIPWVLWLYDCFSGVLMGLRVCATIPSLQDVLLTLRWSIWHYDVPSWSHRGAPEEVLLPGQLIPEAPTKLPSLTYLHINLASEVGRGAETTWAGFPEEMQYWLEQIDQNTKPQTIADLYDYILVKLSQDAQERYFAASTPLFLQAYGVSLPWSTGIAAAKLLPSGGQTEVTNGKVYLFGVPFDVPNVEDGTSVDLRYNPDDARTIYLIHHGAHVSPAPASAFEGVRVSWYELVPVLSSLC